MRYRDRVYHGVEAVKVEGVRVYGIDPLTSGNGGDLFGDGTN